MPSVFQAIASMNTQWNNDNESFLIYSTMTAVVVIISGLFISKQISQRKLKQKLKEFEKKSTSENKVILHTSKPWNFPTPHGLPAVSKLITFLEYTKIDYIIDDTMPKHFYTTKSPWITYKNQHLTDSNLIIEWISNQSEFDKINIDSHLNKSQLAVLIAFKSMIENDLYFIIIWRRFCLDNNINTYLKLITNDRFPSWILSIICKIMKRKQKEKAWAQGIARFKADEIYKKHYEIIESIFDFMGDKKFMFGDKLTTLDLSIYGHIGGMYQLCNVMTWSGSKNIPSKMPFTNEINDYMKRIEMESFGRVKYWKDI